MARITFQDLAELYSNIAFGPDGDDGILTIASPRVLDLIRQIEGDERTSEDANLSVLVEPDALEVGQAVPVRVGAPRLALGMLARRFDDLLAGPEARLQEPHAYYVIEGGLARTRKPPSQDQVRYRKVLELVQLFADSAAYLDRTRQELVFFREGKFVVPVRYNAAGLAHLSLTAADGLLEHFRDDVHKDQKLALLAEAIAHVSEPQPETVRFVHLIQNLDVVDDEVRKGYLLFASSFSYAKIRSEIEAAKVDYVGKIHRTLIDVQGQLLGIPVATIVVASQLRLATVCGVDAWTNFAVLIGAWIFVLLLLVSLVNQWVTLQAISEEVAGQERKLSREFAAISGQFSTVFQGLKVRINWHRFVLIIIGAVAVAGALFATAAYNRLTSVTIGGCFAETPAPVQLAVGGD